MSLMTVLGFFMHACMYVHTYIHTYTYAYYSKFICTLTLYSLSWCLKNADIIHTTMIAIYARAELDYVEIITNTVVVSHVSRHKKSSSAARRVLKMSPKMVIIT